MARINLAQTNQEQERVFTKIITETSGFAELSPQQDEGVVKIKYWYAKEPQKQTFVLGGLAGTGKTYLISFIIKALDIKLRQVAFATFTGKAALIMTQKADGKYTCSTLHSLLYEVEVDRWGNPTFTKKSKSAFDHIKLIVVDECSMVSEELLNDLMELGIKILFVGDYGQLQPVGKISWLYLRLKNEPDHRLSQIHRQAADNPIIDLAHRIRKGLPIPYCVYGDKVAIVPKNEIYSKYFASMTRADQVLCGTNITRNKLNTMLRKVKGFNSSLPQNGDKVICMKNNWGQMIEQYALVNGMMGTISNVKNEGFNVRFNFTPDFVDTTVRLKAINKEFEIGSMLPYKERGKFDPQDPTDAFTFGDAITTHKAQGSQWGSVFVVNETFGSCRANRYGYNPEWLYTALTRAEEKAIIAL